MSENNQIILIQNIQNLIFTIRNNQVMIDRDLAEIFQVETRALNQAVKRNSERFPDDFMFQLTNEEWIDLQSQIVTSSITSQQTTRDNENLKSQNVISSEHGGRRKRPFVFTEQGVAGLSGVLKSKTATKVHVDIMRAFVAMRHILLENSLINHRLDKIERKQMETDQRFEHIFEALENKDAIPSQGVFFNNQVFDAYKLASKIIRSAKKSIVLIDNYIDDTVLSLFSKKDKKVNCTIFTKIISKELKLDAEKFNKQYPTLQIKQFSKAHDRFLIIDQNEVYHIGASLKDLGKKWFAFSKMDKSSIKQLLNSISEML